MTAGAETCQLMRASQWKPSVWTGVKVVWTGVKVALTGVKVVWTGETAAWIGLMVGMKVVWIAVTGERVAWIEVSWTGAMAAWTGVTAEGMLGWTGATVAWSVTMETQLWWLWTSGLFDKATEEQRGPWTAGEDCGWLATAALWIAMALTLTVGAPDLGKGTGIETLPVCPFHQGGTGLIRLSTLGEMTDTETTYLRQPH